MSMITDQPQGQPSGVVTITRMLRMNRFRQEIERDSENSKWLY